MRRSVDVRVTTRSLAEGEALQGLDPWSGHESQTCGEVLVAQVDEIRSSVIP